VDAFQTLAGIREALESGKTSCRERVSYFLQKCREAVHLNAFVELFEEEALQAATRIDQKIQNGTAGRLAGLVVGIKDVICYQDHLLTASSPILSSFSARFSATAVERLLEEDAIILGRQNCDEFAMGSSNETSRYGITRNPVDPERVPGGSSGGSAAAVAAGLCDASLGSDTGGSVRQPAGFCGVSGFKPTYGRISRWGLIAYASSFDQIGIISKHVEDAALILEVIAGPDGRDSTASTEAVPSYSAAIRKGPDRKFRIGYIRETLESQGLDAQIRRESMEMIDRLRAAGHVVEPVSFPYLEFVVPCYYILTTAEASSNLSRYDGIRYGYRTPSPGDLNQTYTQSRSEGFGVEVKRRILLGTFILSAGYYDAYYAKAQKVRRLIREQTFGLLKEYDFLMSPTSPGAAFRIGEKTADPISMYLSDIYTVHANLAGLPAISLPLLSAEEGLPAGMQFMAAPFKESDLLAFSHDITQNENLLTSTT
jgi:aspartyl-tRNA(Asn)/glutamyl-tRNA(Gln) amidotransferase subunit A